jgi:dimeric dUTPase (all-alpha-NTP-PPase superfamily)
MNIDDQNKDEIVIPDNPVLAMLKAQDELRLKYSVIETKMGLYIPDEPFQLDDRSVQYRIKDMFWRVTEELIEAIDSKATTQDILDWAECWEDKTEVRHFFEELADAWHFLLEASLLANLWEPLELHEIEVWKNSKLPCTLLSMSRNKLKLLIFDIIESMGLAANMLKNKPWKQTDVPTDVTRFKRELVITWKSFIELWRVCNCSLNDVYVFYALKNKVNHWRQKTNY